jgi:hypothetical protein
MSFPYTFPFYFETYAYSSADTGSGGESPAMVLISSADTGSGSDIGGRLEDLFSQDAGGGQDNVRILTGKAGTDLRLNTHRGKVNISHKEVNL